MSEFAGFPAGCIPFLEALRRNNDREWLAARKDEYETQVREPALAFVAAMAPALERIAPDFNAIPKKVGGSLMRVQRDTRFTKDKAPYKTNIGIQFRHALGKDVHAPGFYVHIEPGRCFVGAGIWHPEPKVLTRIRDFLADNPASWTTARNHGPFAEHFVMEGESLKRPPRGYAPDHPLIDDLKRKDFIARCDFDESEIGAAAFTKLVADRFGDAVPLVAYLCAALDLPF